MKILIVSLCLWTTTHAPLPEDFIVVAHRGVVTETITENSLAALEAAIARGYTHVEVDIRGTKDGHPVCLHDDSLLRTTGVEKRVGEVTLAELQELVDPAKVPTLAVFCAKAAGRIALMPDMKGCPVDQKDAFLTRVDTILTRNDLMDAALFIGRLDFARPFGGRARIAWRVPLDRAQTSARVKEADLGKRYFIFNHGDDFDAERVQGFQALGLPVIVSINTGHYKDGDPIVQGETHIRAMLELGVDGLQIDSVYDHLLFGAAE